MARNPKSLPDLHSFATAIGSASTALRRDECGDWRISGKRGHVYAVPGGFELYCAPGSARAWTFAKKALSFAMTTNDGDDEGMFIVDRLPLAAEAEVIRSYLGVRKRVDLSDGRIAALRERGKQLGAMALQNRRSSSSIGNDIRGDAPGKIRREPQTEIAAL